MRLLLDTNVFLWWQWRDRRRPSRAKVALEDRENDMLVRAAAIWEVCIKRHIGKLEFEGSPTTACTAAGFRLLDMTAAQAEAAGDQLANMATRSIAC